MLVAHLVPGYFAASLTKPSWDRGWTSGQRASLWAAAIASTVLPDVDVAYNVLFRGFFNHSTLWSHSVFPYLALGAVWLGLKLADRAHFARLLAGLFAIGGLGHILLDIGAHGTPLLYPVSLLYVSLAPQRVVEGGVLAYITDPAFLLEPMLLAILGAHITFRSNLPVNRKRLAATTLVVALILIAAVFLMMLPHIQVAVQHG